MYKRDIPLKEEEFSKVLSNESSNHYKAIIVPKFKLV